MSHVWMSHVTHMNESCHTYEWVMAHVWMSHGTRMNDSCETYAGVMWHIHEWVMAHIWVSHGTYMNESWHTYEWVMAQISCTNALALIAVMRHIRMSHVTHTNESWDTYEWVMGHIRMSHNYKEETRQRYEGHSLNEANSCAKGAVSCTHEWVMSHIRINHVIHVIFMNEWLNADIKDTPSMNPTPVLNEVDFIIRECNSVLSRPVNHRSVFICVTGLSSYVSQVCLHTCHSTELQWR